MGFRFQKRIKLFPGVSINLSKSGISTSVGTTGARYTVGNGKRRATVGLPGTGLSYTQVQSTRRKQNAAQPAQREEDGIDRALNLILKTVLWSVAALVFVLWIAK